MAELNLNEVDAVLADATRHSQRPVPYGYNPYADMTLRVAKELRTEVDRLRAAIDIAQGLGAFPAHKDDAAAHETSSLPPLEQPCPECTGEAGQKMREATEAEWRKWDAEYSAAVEEDGGCSFYGSAAEKELFARQPEEMAGNGCIECAYTGLIPTEFGRTLLAFVRRHGGA